jgi:hypothetical protein
MGGLLPVHNPAFAVFGSVLIHGLHSHRQYFMKSWIHEKLALGGSVDHSYRPEFESGISFMGHGRCTLPAKVSLQRPRGARSRQ